ncbi:MAG TPA: ABC transporter permease [Sandaracinaceae bacterium LLY-WYZ-13_1]|nr:ABC transporter permease [Sandaracinaceae bacterium LLY-WYZ-13_1]
MRRFARRVWALAAKEVRHVLRDPRTLYLALGMPVVMLLLFGYGVSFDLEHLPVAFVDLDRSASSRALRRRFTANDQLDDAGTLATTAEAERTLVAGEAIAALVIPEGFEADLRRGRDVDLQLLLDGADNNSAVQAQAKAETAARVLGLSLATRVAGDASPPIATRSWTRFNPESRSAVFLVPGITAYVLAIVAVLLTALTVSREWERGSMAQLFATPVGRLEIVLGKLLPYLVLGTLVVLLVLAVGTWVFDVPFRGSPFALAVLSVLFIAGMLGQGLLVSVVARNQMVATQVATLSSMLPSMLLSGFVFPIQNMPQVLQWITVVIPARYFVEGLRGVLLRGNDLSLLWPQAAALTAFALVMVVASTARFRRTIA